MRTAKECGSVVELMPSRQEPWFQYPGLAKINKNYYQAGYNLSTWEAEFLASLGYTVEEEGSREAR